jgi:hypothetical protein
MKDIKEIEKMVDKLTLSPQKKKRKRTMSRRMAIAATIVVSCFVITASAALLSYYGQITTTAEVSQSVKVDGHAWDNDITHDFTGSAGSTIIYKHKIENTASVEAEIEIVTTGEVNGINVEYYLMDGWKTLTLENKDSNWDILNDDYSAEFTYNPCCPNLIWELEGTFAANTGYVLIYYADQPDRFTNWGGAPALELATFTSDENGDFSESGSQNLAACLPYEDDWNIGPDADYTDNNNGYDDYEHGKGAKIWVVPVAYYDGTNEELTAWAPSEILFETDLIGYFDCNINPLASYLNTYFDYETPMSGTTYTLEPGEQVCLFVSYNFDVALIPGEYTIKTKIKPVTT